MDDMENNVYILDFNRRFFFQKSLEFVYRFKKAFQILKKIGRIGI